MGAASAVLVLEDGRVFRGTSFGAVGQTLGEAVFSTGMTGYQETLTDPSYHRQIVVSTAPQIGNTGWNEEDDESVGPTGDSAEAKIWVAGYVVRDPSRCTSSWRATGSLHDELVKQDVVVIAEIDTRALVRHLRSRGSMRAGVFSGDALAWSGESLDVDTLVDRVRQQPSMLGADLAGEVTTTSGYIVEPAGGQARFTVAAIDLGIKTNTPRMFAERGVRVHVLPS
ncbi:MAG: carbamoyl phosphate synthase small subunit, partial [Rhodococcus sp.]|nr:carbamoyl phosphate synthase small subunit [Rhodococcus sp. (in: high G+C Gram-positive bacteria)]